MDVNAVQTLLSSDITYAGLFSLLLWYVLKTTGQREQWLREHLEYLDQHLGELTSVLKMLKVELTTKIDSLKDEINELKEKQQKGV